MSASCWNCACIVGMPLSGGVDSTNILSRTMCRGLARKSICSPSHHTLCPDTVWVTEVHAPLARLGRQQLDNTFGTSCTSSNCKIGKPMTTLAHNQPPIGCGWCILKVSYG